MFERHLVTYAEQLERKAEAYGVSLKQAYIRARIDLSTYYRNHTIKERSPSYEKARRVNYAIEHLAALRIKRGEMDDIRPPLKAETIAKGAKPRGVS